MPTETPGELPVTEPADRPESMLVVPCHDLEASMTAAEAAGFRLAALGPADEPTWAELTSGDTDGHVVALVLDTTAAGPLSTRRPDRPPMVVPPTRPARVVSHADDARWTSGRAGMRYRDLIPGRYGGAYIASHIHVPVGGPIPDHVHHHAVVHQLIFCHRGWVRVVYEDQGPALVMRPGDCVLQPPGIRHRVLDCSDDLYVIEVGCPADHRTSLDHELSLPTAEARPERRWAGQRFVHHRAADHPWTDGDEPGRFGHYQDTGLARATDGLVSVRRWRGHPLSLPLDHQADLRLVVVTDGRAMVESADGRVELAEGSSITVPAGQAVRLDGCDESTIVLEVTAAAPPVGSGQ